MGNVAGQYGVGEVLKMGLLKVQGEMAFNL